MNTQVYHFKVGSFECMTVSDGTHTYTPPAFPPPAPLLFANAPKEQLEEPLRQHNIEMENWSEWISPYICLFVNTGERQVLVDTGAGSLNPNTGRLLQNLRTEGITPEDIDLVIFTHCHPDHIGGNIHDDGKLVFPNAHYTMWKDEWDFWTSKRAETELDEHVRDILLSFTRKNLPPIRDRLNLIAHEGDILPGIRAITAPGHTPGHMVIALSSMEEQLLYLSDTVLHPLHLEQPEWCAAVDFSPNQVVITRRHLLNLAAVEKALVLAFHFPFPGLGYVVEKGDAWRWEPI